MEFSAVNTIWVLVGAASRLLHAGRFRHGRDRFYPGKKCRQHHHEKPHGLLYRNTCIFWFVGFGIMFGQDTGWLFGGIGHPHPRSITDTQILDLRFLPGICHFPNWSFAPPPRPSFPAPWRSVPNSFPTVSTALHHAAVVYPVSGHWIWGGGWLAQMGFHDFAGSTAVHMVGGCRALIGAWMLGPRIGKYDKDGTPQRHSRTQPDARRAGRVHPLVLLVRLQRLLDRLHEGRPFPAAKFS